MSDYVKSAGRALDILVLLSKHTEGLTFSDICSKLGWPKSSAHGLLMTLTSRRFLEFDEIRKSYSIGLRAWEIGRTYLFGDNLAHEATPYMHRIRNELNETIQLAVLDGAENLYIAKIDAPQPLSLASRVGLRLPAYATGVGKVLLAGLPASEVDQVMSSAHFTRFTRATIDSMPRLKRELDAIRERGYGYDDGEYTDGLGCVAVPIRNSDRRTVAAMSVSVPQSRLTPQHREHIIQCLLSGAAEISRRLGYADDAAS